MLKYIGTKEQLFGYGFKEIKTKLAKKYSTCREFVNEDCHILLNKETGFISHDSTFARTKRNEETIDRFVTFFNKLLEDELLVEETSL